MSNREYYERQSGTTKPDPILSRPLPVSLQSNTIRQNISAIERIKQKATYLGTASFVPSLSFLSYAELGVSEAEWMQLIEPVLKVLAEKGEKTIQALRVEIGAVIERGEHL